MDRTLSQAAHERACCSIVGGVNSPVRSFRAVGVRPVVAQRGEGAHLWDVDGNRYVDYLMSWGALILGHAHPDVLAALAQTAQLGTSYGLSTEAESDLAELIRDAFPSIDLVRLVNSGTEAMMSAVRLARGYTGREKVLVFEGCYHGHSDGFLAGAGSGLATLSIPASAGVPESFVHETLIAPYNDLDAVEALCPRHGDELAAIVVEPVAGNMGVVPPAPGFLEGLRLAADRTGALLIFDEVITGFRLAWGGAQERYGVRADLTALGKIIGGGLPVGAFGGRRDVMERLAPLGDVYQAGTLSGNPLVARAGAAVLRRLRHDRPYGSLEECASELAACVRHAALVRNVPLRVHQVGPMFTCFFTDQAVRDYRSACETDGELYGAFFAGLLEEGVLLAPSAFEACFLSTAHGPADLQATVGACEKVLDSLGRPGA